jgi:uncharacterized membrane protein YfcA
VAFVYCVLIGMAAGFFSGLFGVGGGIIAIPLLVMALGYKQHFAQGTAALMILPTVAVVGWRYWQAGNADIWLGLALAAGAVPVGYLSSAWAQKLPQIVLRRGFAVLLLAVALQMWFGSARKS